MEGKAIYLIYSTQKLLLEEAAQRLSKKLYGQEQGASLNFQGQDATGEEIVSHCQSLSFFGQRQLIIVDNCFSLKSKDKNSLIAYIKNPNPDTVLVLKAALAPAEIKKIKTDPLFVAVAASPYGQTYFYEVKNLTSWVKKQLASFGKTALPAEISYLILAVGEDLLKLKQEIAKIAAYCGEKSEVSLTDIKAVVSPTVEANVFSLIEAISEGDIKTALTLSRLLLASQEKVDSIVNLIDQQLNLITLFLIYKSEGITQPTELAKKLAISKGRLFYLKKQAVKFSVARLKKALAALLAYDYKRKTQVTEEKLAFEELIINLCSMGQTL